MFAALIGFLILQRVFELALAARNRRWLLARGGAEVEMGTHPIFLAVHVLFFISLVLEWHYRSRGWNSAWPLWLALLLASQLVRVWTMRSLGPFWNTRIIVMPGMKPVASGPYRHIRHPNYVVVAVEMAVIPVLCRAYFTAAVFSAAYAFLLVLRIPQEERALEHASGSPLPKLPRFLPRFKRRSG
jgi:methyltransferase